MSFSDDPLRMLRAARFIARYQLQPVPELVAAVVAMHSRLEIVSAERIRDELDKLITVDASHRRAVVPDRDRAGRRVLARAAGDASGAGSDPPPQGRLDATPSPSSRTCGPNARPDFDFRRTRLAALFHDVGKPQTRGYQKGKGVTFHHHDAVGARMTRKRLTALRYSNDDIEAITELVALHLRFHTYQMGWTDSAVRRYVRDAGPLLRGAQRADAMRLHDSQRAQSGRAVATDGRARGADRRARGA